MGRCIQPTIYTQREVTLCNRVPRANNIYIEINLKVENSRNKECIHFKQEKGRNTQQRLLGSSLLH